MALGACAERRSHVVGLEPVGVDVDVLLPLVGRVVLEEDRVHGADRLAGGAVDARLGVDVVLLVILGAVDAVDGADVHAGRVLYADAGLGNDVCHGLRGSRPILSGSGQGGQATFGESAWLVLGYFDERKSLPLCRHSIRSPLSLEYSSSSVRCRCSWVAARWGQSCTS